MGTLDFGVLFICCWPSLAGFELGGLSLHKATSLAQRQNSTGKLFTIFHQQTCVGVPYTKDLSLNCDGWTGLTQDACELNLGPT